MYGKVTSYWNGTALMAAYDVEWVGACERPRLPCVDAAYILTMTDSVRLTPDRLEALRALARHTYVQRNEGYHRCPKEGVDCSARDIVHACRNAFAHASASDGYVLVLEDDAIPMPGAHDGRHFARVDAFLRRHRETLDAYSLGSFGPVWPACDDPASARFCAGFVGFAQAVVYSRRARDRLLRAPLHTVRHVDVHFLARQPRVYTYWRPLVVQTFAHSDNMDGWGLGRAASPSRCERCLVRAFVRLLQRGLGLDRSPRGWRVLYAINHAPSALVATALAVATACGVAAVM